MGVTARWALAGVSVLLVEAPGWGWVRMGAERAVVERGWSLALSPADADAVLLCGAPGERLAGVVDRVWEQLPGPRARAAVLRADEGSLGAVLDGVAAVLGDETHQRADARQRAQEPGTGGGMDMDMDMGGDTDGGEGDDAGSDGSDGSDGDSMDGDDAGSDGDDTDMDMSPDGIALAGGSDDDRDGLEMDVLYVPLGPVLPAWPASLVLRCVLAGDVVTHAETEVLDAAAPAPAPDAQLPVVGAAVALDRVVRVLDLAGPQHLAVAVRRARDLTLSAALDVPGGPPSLSEPAGSSDLGDLDREVERLERSVARSRLLRWSLRGLGALDDDALAAHGLPRDHRGDVHDRLLAALAAARAILRGEPPDRGPVGTGTGPDQCDLGPGDAVAAARAALPGLVTGYELAAVRLVVASLTLEEPPGSPALQPAGSGEGERG